jgi:hypothetical protein
MIDRDIQAVFSADEYGHVSVWSGEDVKLYVNKCINWQHKQFYALKPTPEDIEAARKAAELHE